MPGDWTDTVDLVKLAGAVHEALATQTPNARRALEELIADHPVDVERAGPAWVVLSVDGVTFARVHRTRVLGGPRPRQN
jgi:hypothetical protein